MTTSSLPSAWSRVVIYTHRWLGMVFGVLFLMWFLSGIVMMYVRMPRLSAEERVMQLAALDLSRARVAPAEAAENAGLLPQQLRIGMLGDRPVYRFAQGARWTTVFADNGQLLSGLSADEVLLLVPEYTSTRRYDRYLTEADQWTLQLRSLMPIHRIALGDSQDTYLYISDQTGERVMKTMRRERLWAYFGPVPHWVYFTPLRRHTGLWSQLLIWLSMGGCLLTLSGLAWGIWSYSFTVRYRLGDVRSRSPFTGLMRWHHYAGLVFGLVTFTWIFSGGLSLDPWRWNPSTSSTSQQRQALAGGGLQLKPLTLERLRACSDAIASSFASKELEVVQFQGELFLIALRAGSFEPIDEQRNTKRTESPRLRIEHRLISTRAPEEGVFEKFDDGAMQAAARAAMPGAKITGAVWLQEYDSYYYDRERKRPLPVFRVRYDDPVGTWLYLDPQRGSIAHKEERFSRVNRWLYHGLHSLDFPFLYYRRPLWDIVVIVLSLGGVLLSTSTIVPAWRRLRRHVRCLKERMSARS